MRYGFLSWRDFFNDRQLLALSLLRSAIVELADAPTRDALLDACFRASSNSTTCLPPTKEKARGPCGTCSRIISSNPNARPSRQMSGERQRVPAPSPISFAADFFGPSTTGNRRRKSTARAVPAVASVPCRLRANCTRGVSRCLPRAIALSCGDSSATGLPDGSVDLVVTDPPFFDNVHYSELADFFFAWQQLPNGGTRTKHSPQE